jgi:RimJ/RimL family protein N-acetyltransferase
MTTPGEPLPTAANLLRVFANVQTGRLILRRPREDDSAARFRIHSDPATHRYSPDSRDPDQAASDSYLRGWLAHWMQDGFGYWTVVLPETAEIIGFGGVRRMAWRDRDILNLYYRFTPSAWGHGYASEVARESVRLARAHIPTLPIVARVRAANIPSIKTAERAGLSRRPDLDTSDHLIYALGWPSLWS